jgi:hypothetical protein
MRRFEKMKHNDKSCRRTCLKNDLGNTNLIQSPTVETVGYQKINRPLFEMSLKFELIIC